MAGDDGGSVNASSQAAGLFSPADANNHDDHDSAATTTPTPKNKFECQWEKKFQRLIKFKALHGHTTVTAKNATKDLVNWVTTQRARLGKRRKGCEDEDKATPTDKYRIQRLEEIGFNWPQQRQKKRQRANPNQNRLQPASLSSSSHAPETTSTAEKRKNGRTPPAAIHSPAQAASAEAAPNEATPSNGGADINESPSFKTEETTPTESASQKPMLQQQQQPAEEGSVRSSSSLHHRHLAQHLPFAAGYRMLWEFKEKFQHTKVLRGPNGENAMLANWVKEQKEKWLGVFSGTQEMVEGEVDQLTQLDRIGVLGWQYEDDENNNNDNTSDNDTSPSPSNNKNEVAPNSKNPNQAAESTTAAAAPAAQPEDHHINEAIQIPVRANNAAPRRVSTVVTQDGDEQQQQQQQQRDMMVVDPMRNGGSGGDDDMSSLSGSTDIKDRNSFGHMYAGLRYSPPSHHPMPPAAVNNHHKTGLSRLAPVGRNIPRLETCDPDTEVEQETGSDPKDNRAELSFQKPTPVRPQQDKIPKQVQLPRGHQNWLHSVSCHRHSSPVGCHTRECTFAHIHTEKSLQFVQQHRFDDRNVRLRWDRDSNGQEVVTSGYVAGKDYYYAHGFGGVRAHGDIYWYYSERKAREAIYNNVTMNPKQRPAGVAPDWLLSRGSRGLESCRFFLGPRGCRLGRSCRYAHAFYERAGQLPEIELSERLVELLEERDSDGKSWWTSGVIVRNEYYNVFGGSGVKRGHLWFYETPQEATNAMLSLGASKPRAREGIRQREEEHTTPKQFQFSSLGQNREAASAAASNSDAKDEVSKTPEAPLRESRKRPSPEADLGRQNKKHASTINVEDSDLEPGSQGARPSHVRQLSAELDLVDQPKEKATMIDVDESNAGPESKEESQSHPQLPVLSAGWLYKDHPRYTTVCKSFEKNQRCSMGKKCLMAHVYRSSCPPLSTSFNERHLQVVSLPNSSGKTLHTCGYNVGNTFYYVFPASNSGTQKCSETKIWWFEHESEARAAMVAALVEEDETEMDL